VSRSLDLTGSDWGFRKKTQRQTYRKAGIRWVWHSWWEMPATPSTSKRIYLYSEYGKAGWKCRSCSHGSSCIGARNSAAMVCCYLLQTILTTSVCPVLPARQPDWTLPPLGWAHAYQPGGPLTELCSCHGLSPLLQSPYLQGSLAEPCSPPSCQGLAFSAQRTLTMALLMSEFLLSLFSYSSPTIYVLCKGRTVFFHLWVIRKIFMFQNDHCGHLVKKR
jgi:hypothetical protein